MAGTNFGSIGEAFVNIRANLATLDKDLARIGGKIQKAGAGLRRTGLQISLFLAVPIALVGVKAIKTASDVQEMENLFDVTFENMSKDVRDWARVTARAMQRSRFDMMQTASSFAAFLKPLGVAPAAIVPMAKALAALTTDVSSFRNVAEKEVFTRLFSGLAGETEAVRRLGIDIGVTSINIELMRLGINKTSAEATQAEKVMARFNLIMAQTSDAQGDAVRTAFFFENQVRGMSATIKDLLVTVGQKLLPIATRAVQKIRALGEEFLALDSKTQSGTIALVIFVGVIGPAIIAFGLLLQAIGFAIKGFAIFVPLFKGVAFAFRAFITGMRLASASLALIFAGIPLAAIAAFAAVVGAVLIFKETLVGFFKGLIKSIKKEFVEKFNNVIVVPFQEAINSIVEFLPESVVELLGLKPLEVNEVIDNDFTDDMKAVFVQAKLDGIREMNEFSTGVKSIITKVKDTVTGLPDVFGDLFDFDIADIGAGFDDLLAQFQAAANAAAGLGKSVAGGASIVSEAWKQVMDTVTTSVEDGLVDLATSFRSFGDIAVGVLRQIAAEFLRLAVIRPFLTFLGLPIPGLEHGGSARANQPVVVGEGGPELFVPNVSGNVIPNNRLNFGDGGDRMGGGDVNQEFNFSMVFPTQLEAFVRNVGGSAGRDAAVQVFQARQGKF